MTQRIALTIAAALSAFVLVLIAGVAARVSQSPVAVAPTEVPTAAPTTAATLDPTAQAIIAERDAAYQEALAQANAQIEQANAQIEQANAQIEQANAATAPAAPAAAPAAAAPAAIAPAPAAPAAPAPVAPTYAVSAEQAVTLAQGAAYGVASTKAPELVSLQGIPAYEVTFAQGLVYIDANSGAVLASSIPAPAAQPGQSYEDDEHEEREHEEREHEEGEHEESEGGDDD